MHTDDDTCYKSLGLNFKWVITRYPNPHMRDINIDKPLPLVRSFDMTYYPCPDEYLPLFDNLLGIPGVAGIAFSDVYEICITKGKVFNFNEIIPVALEIINDFYKTFTPTIKGEV